MGVVPLQPAHMLLLLIHNARGKAEISPLRNRFAESLHHVRREIVVELTCLVLWISEIKNKVSLQSSAVYVRQMLASNPNRIRKYKVKFHRLKWFRAFSLWIINDVLVASTQMTCLMLVREGLGPNVSPEHILFYESRRTHIQKLSLASCQINQST